MKWTRPLASLFVLAALLVGTPFAMANQGTPAPSSDGVIAAASGLTNPRGFAWGPDGSLYVAEARVIPEDDATTDRTSGELEGIVVRIQDGCPVVFQGNLPSSEGSGGPDLGPSGLAFLNGALHVLDEGGGSAHGNPLTPDGIYRIDGGGSAVLVADVGAWVDANPVAESPASHNPGGDLTGMVGHDGALVIVESNGGQVLKVTADGAITRITDLSGEEQKPRGIATGADGRLYVGLTGTDDVARIVAIGPDGTVEDVWTGLTSVADVAISQDGTLYALQMGTATGDDAWSFEPGSGSVVRQSGPDTSALVATGFDTPIAMAFGPDQGLYVSSPAVGGDFAGSVIRLDTAQGQVMTVTDKVLADSPCLPASAPDEPASPVASPTDDTLPATPGADDPDSTGDASVEIANFEFEPGTLTVAAGSTVTWTNNDTAPHTVTASDGSFDSGNIDPGETFSFTFETEGTFDYVCSYHPGMAGSVTVTGAADASGDTNAAGDGAATPPPATPAPEADAEDQTVSIEDFAFGPDTLTIPAGTTVTWVNNDTTAHTASAADRSFDSGNLAPGDSYAFRFDTPGTYAYACMYHPNMTATIIVE